MTEVRIDAIEAYLAELWELGGSDVLLTAGVPPLLRVDGAMRPADGAATLEPADLERIVRSVLPPEIAARFEEEKDADFSFSWKDLARFRGNVFVQRGSMAMALRLIPFKVPSFEELGLPAVIERFVRQPRGLVLATGPTGAGKSTTLASMIDRINQERSCHVVTVEDPIEYVHHHGRSAVNQREVGQDASSFARALRSALRADPDVLLVGEMRDLETIQTVLTMAETGHLVFGTLHTNDAAQAIDRIVDVFPSERQQQIRVQLSNTLTGVICQQLLPRIGGGRVAAFEILVANHAVRNLVKEGKTNQLRNVQLTGHEEGMSTLEASLSDLVIRGVITYEDALSRSLFPKELAKPRPVPPAPGAPVGITAEA
jgi:twitching motility protein PilT